MVKASAMAKFISILCIVAVSISIGVIGFSGDLSSSEKISSGIADANDAQRVIIGKKLYQENCASCHGANLEGQPNWRAQLPTGGLPAPPHDETGHTWHHSDQSNFNYTKFGGQKIAPEGFKSNMPGFESQLSDEQIWSVLAYIKSQWPERVRRRHKRINIQSK